MVFLLRSYIRPILEFSSPVWNTGYLEDSKLLEKVQRSWTRNISGLENLPYEERLAALNLYSVRGRLLRADMIKCFKIFHGLSPISPTDVFVLDGRPGTRGHRFKIFHQRVFTDARSRFFSNRCANTWNGLPSAVVTAASVAAFKRGLHSALGGKNYLNSPANLLAQLRPCKL